MTRDNLLARTKKQLSELARSAGIAGWHGMTKEQLVKALVAKPTKSRSKASKSARAISNNLVEVHLNVRHSSDPAARLQIQQWRVEREDGTILCFGQDREFKRDLPVGRYKVELKLQRDASGTTPVVRGTLSVSAEEATIQQRTLARR